MSYNKLKKLKDLTGNLNSIINIYDDLKNALVEHEIILNTNGDIEKLKTEIDNDIAEAIKLGKGTAKKTLMDKIRDKITQLHEICVQTLKQHYGHGIKSKHSNMMRPQDHALGQNYMIDTDKLRKNILEIRYIKNRHLTNIKSQLITAGVKQILDEFIQHRTFNDREYNKLTNVDKHLIRTIFHTIKHQHLVTDKEDDFNRQFEILRDEWLAGNNSEIIKRQLRQYIHHAINTKLLSRAEGLTYLNELENRK
jgi:hypothetical protein